MVQHIGISGNIGSGKTTLAEKLSKHYSWIPEYEDEEKNPYLADFYKDMNLWSFHLQIYFLNSRFSQLKKIQKSDTTVVQDRTIYEDAYIFAANLFESGYMKEREYKNYLSIFESMVDVIRPPDLLIYLRADIPKLVQQIEKRGRKYEELIRLEYLKNLNFFYEKWIKSYDKGKLLIIDVNNIDFVKNVSDFAMIIDKIDVELHGLFSN